MMLTTEQRKQQRCTLIPLTEALMNRALRIPDYTEDACDRCDMIASKTVDGLCIRCYHQPTHRGMQAAY